MRYCHILLSFILLILIPESSCRSRGGPTNEYRNARTHPSETIASGHKRLERRAKRALKRNERRARRNANKRNSDFFKT